jgi:hypothetical protein
MPDARIHVDFNDIEDDSLTALVRHADDPSALAPGVRVTLWDEEGNTAEGRVIELGERGVVRIALISGTWRSRLTPQQGPEPATVEDLMRALFESYATRVNSVQGFYRLSQVPSHVASATAPTTSRWLPALPQPRTAVPSSL